ncbi:unnamed protein product [marine sediment metagenome]|uniref:Uncharacterized protein n=1 Tax=marine sediment metagenome TaxID=412755 RepID=X1E872_9ZZZZ
MVAIVIAMLMFYQKEPVYTLVICGVGLTLYLYYKAKKSGKGLLGSFFSGPQSSQERNFDDLVALMMLQQLISSNPQTNTASKQISEDSRKRKEEIEKTQKEVLDLLSAD